MAGFENAMLTGRAFAAGRIGFGCPVLPGLQHAIKQAPGPFHLIVSQKVR